MKLLSVSVLAVLVASVLGQDLSSSALNDMDIDGHGYDSRNLRGVGEYKEKLERELSSTASKNIKKGSVNGKFN